jgi:hypothetical protein
MDTPPVLSLGEFVDIAFSLRGALLIAVSAIFTGILAMFFAMNLRMKYQRQETEKLVEFSSLGAYSKFFQVMDNNENATSPPVES